MTRLREHFETESAECLDALERLTDDAGADDPGELYRLARMLRGGAQMAREDRPFRAAAALEAAARAVARGALRWEEDARDRVRATITDLRALIDADAPDHDQEARVAAVLERWLQIGLALPETDVGRTLTGSDRRDDERAPDADRFRSFAAREVAAIASTLAQGVEALVHDPSDREPLKAILRRQRALLGTARLDEMAVIPETLRAVEDLSRVIARLGVAVKDEWLDVYRSARDVMRGASEALERDETPAPSNALSRLRTLHAEILERYGAAESTPAQTALSRVMATTAPAPAEAPAAPAELDVQDLMYDRDEAVRRIFDLRPRIDAGVSGKPDAVAAVDELFDLLRHILK